MTFIQISVKSTVSTTIENNAITLLNDFNKGFFLCVLTIPFAKLLTINDSCGNMTHFHLKNIGEGIKE